MLLCQNTIKCCWKSRVKTEWTNRSFCSKVSSILDGFSWVDSRIQWLLTADTESGNPSQRTSIILFLNKIDLFKAKLPKVPLERYFPEYTGGPDVNKGAKYILWRFTQLNRARLSIYPHLTQATDTSNVSRLRSLSISAWHKTEGTPSLTDSTGLRGCQRDDLTKRFTRFRNPLNSRSISSTLTPPLTRSPPVPHLTDTILRSFISFSLSYSTTILSLS